jgi:hypothetical protein
MIPWTIVLIALAIIYVVGCFLVELEYFGWATVVLIASVISVQSLHVFDFLSYVAANALTSAIYATGYVAVGVVWSFIKWFSFLMKYRDKFRELKLKFLTQKQIPHSDKVPVPAELEADFSRFLGSQYSTGDYASLRDGKKPIATESKARITAWMAFWPCSVLSTLLNDPIRRLFKFLFNIFKGLFQKLSDFVFKNDPELK